MLYFKKSELEDWYTIEGTGVYYSVEGDKEDMLQIAKAIRDKSYFCGVRCAVCLDDYGYFRFECPRSVEEGYGHEFTVEQAQALAQQIEEELLK